MCGYVQYAYMLITGWVDGVILVLCLSKVCKSEDGSIIDVTIVFVGNVAVPCYPAFQIWF